MGRTTPDAGFDASGFVQYVFAHFDIDVGRKTTDQLKAGTAVTKEELSGGDIVLFGNNKDLPNHVGIYVGNNTYIHSPQNGEVVKISIMDRTDFITGRRVIK